MGKGNNGISKTTRTMKQTGKESTLIFLQAEMTDEQLEVLVSEIKIVAEYIGIKLTVKTE
jgi:hypothetical protein